MLPGDLVWPGFNLDDAYTGEDENPWTIADGRRHRAQVQADYAREEGLSFGDVTCVRIWAYPLTRQEAWEEGGMDEARDAALDEWAEENGLKYDFLLAQWKDKAGRVWPEPEFDEAVPPDWDGDGAPAWDRTVKADPRAVPGWECSW